MSEKFEGFEPANTTPVPDVLFDELLPTLKEAELKALLYIIRRTLGFKKSTDAISLSQFQKGITTKDGRVLDKGCGVKDRTTLVKALASLVTKGCIECIKTKTSNGDDDITLYRIRFREVVGNSYHPQPEGSGKFLPPVVGKPYHGSGQTLPQVVGNSYPQETVKQQTVLQETVKQQDSNVATAHADVASTSHTTSLSEKKEAKEIPTPEPTTEQSVTPPTPIVSAPPAPGKPAKGTKTPSGLSKEGQHIRELWETCTKRKLSLTPANIKALNGLGEVVENDEDFFDVYKMMKDYGFYKEKNVRIDIDFMFRKFDGWIGKVDEYRREAEKKRMEEERREQMKKEGQNPQPNAPRQLTDLEKKNREMAARFMKKAN